MTLGFVVTVALAVATAAAQTPGGEIAGRVSDEQRSPLPGARIRITIADQSTEAVTDAEGRFFFRSLKLGTYHVLAELPGFKSASGEMTISPSVPRAFLAWSLEPGCLTEVQRIILAPRDAARLVEAIVHIRVASTAGPVIMSVRPDCEGRVFQEYSVQVLGSAPGRGLLTGPGQEQLFMERRNARLRPGEEYLALLWPDRHTTDDLVLPIVSGRVASPGAGELNGLHVNEALNILAKWAEERQR